MPVIDGGVELNARIGARPRGVRDLLPQFAGLDGLHHGAALARGQFPIGVFQHGLQKGIGDTHGIVRILARDGHVGFRIPIRAVGTEIDIGLPLPRQRDHTLDVIVGDHRLARGLHLAPQGWILAWVEAIAV